MMMKGSSSEEESSPSKGLALGLRRARKTRIRERRGAVASSVSCLRSKRPCSLLDDAMTAVSEIMKEEQERLHAHHAVIPDDDDSDDECSAAPIGFIGTKRHRRNSCLSSFSSQDSNIANAAPDSTPENVISSLTHLHIQPQPNTTDSPNNSTRRVSDEDLQASQQVASVARRKAWLPI